MSVSKRDRLAGLLGRFGVLRALECIAHRGGLLVVNYHRIGSPNGNPFDDAVFSATADEFRAQVRYLRDHFDLPSLDQLVEIQEAGFVMPRPMALITFDDGYRDNFDLALPVLREFGATAAFFIPTSYIQSPRLPWWDHIAYVIKQTRREEFTLEYPTHKLIDLRRTSRPNAVLEVLTYYKCARDVKERDFLEHLGESAEVDVDAKGLARDLFMSWDQIRMMNAEGMSIGSHTHKHEILSKLSESDQRAELVVSKQILEDELGRPVKTIAYPVGTPGTFNAVTKRLAQVAGYRIGFSYYGGINRTGHADPLDVRRTTVDITETFPLFRARAALHTLVGTSI
jgi:peptidoglycan/xylan/chitin deacetylase (PgdA/CDA1 family)